MKEETRKLLRYVHSYQHYVLKSRSVFVSMNLYYVKQAQRLDLKGTLNALTSYALRLGEHALETLRQEGVDLQIIK